MPGTGEQGGRLFVVATPIGNLEDMTYRAVRVLGEVDVVAAEDTRTADRLLRHFGIRGPRVVSYFEGNEAARSGELVERMTHGASVAVISEAGMPGVSDPGERLVAAAVEAGVPVEVVPGASAVLAALVGSGAPTDRFLFAGFPPRDPGPRRQFLGELRGHSATVVLYESPNRVAACLADVSDAMGADRPVVVARELTKLHEEYVRGTAADLRDRFTDAAPRGECGSVIHGAPDDATSAEPVDVEAEMRALLAQGLGPKDAAARLVVKTGKPKRQLYQLALSLKRTEQQE